MQNSREGRQPAEEPFVGKRVIRRGQNEGVEVIASPSYFHLLSSFVPFFVSSRMKRDTEVGLLISMTVFLCYVSTHMCVFVSVCVCVYVFVGT